MNIGDKVRVVNLGGLDPRIEIGDIFFIKDIYHKRTSSNYEAFSEDKSIYQRFDLFNFEVVEPMKNNSNEIKLTHIDNTPRRSDARDLFPKKSKAITLTDLEDIIDEIREFEDIITSTFNEQGFSGTGQTLVEKLEYIRRALTHVQIQQKSYMEAIELYTQNLNKSIG